MSPSTMPDIPVAVVYDAHDGQRSKLFTDARKARSFYAGKLKEGKNPIVKRAQPERSVQ